jgi:hypothetical protein
LVEFVRSALFHATHHVLISVALIAVVTLGAVALLPKKTEKLEFPDDVAADSA